MTNATKGRCAGVVHLILNFSTMIMIVMAFQESGWKFAGILAVALVTATAAKWVREVEILFDIMSISEGVSEGVKRKVEEL